MRLGAQGLTNRKGVQELLDTTPLHDAMQGITYLLAAGTGKPADPEIYDLAPNGPDGSCQSTTTAASEVALVSISNTVINMSDKSQEDLENRQVQT